MKKCEKKLLKIYLTKLFPDADEKTRGNTSTICGGKKKKQEGGGEILVKNERHVDSAHLQTDILHDKFSASR